MSRPRSTALNLALSLVSVSLMALLAEGAARLYVERVYVDPHEELTPMSRFHPVLGWEKNPGSTRRIRRSEYDVEIAFNSKGLRGPERDYPKPGGTRRILILGDSFAEGYYAEENETARAVLERTLNARGCGPIEVINGGTLAYSTDQEYLFYRDEGSKYGADLVLLFFYSNDLYHNTRGNLGPNRPKPMFYVDGENIILANVPLKEPPPLKREDVVPKAWKGSYALRFLSDRTIDSAPRLHEFLARFGLVQRASTDPSRELWPYGPRNDKEVSDMWDRTSGILRALDREVRSHGARLMTLYVPVRFEVNDAIWELTKERFNMGRRWNREAVFDRLSQILETLRVPLLDPRSALRAVDSGPKPAYYSRDLHWNAEGNRVVGEELADDITRAGWSCEPPSAPDGSSATREGPGPRLASTPPPRP
jgi:hypothetical protein